MDADEKRVGQAVEPLKVASARLLLVKLETAFRNDTLKPINPAAKPEVQEVRVNTK